MSRRGAVGRAINNKHLAEERPGSIPDDALYFQQFLKLTKKIHLIIVIYFN